MQRLAADYCASVSDSFHSVTVVGLLSWLTVSLVRIVERGLLARMVSGGKARVKG